MTVVMQVFLVLAAVGVAIVVAAAAWSARDETWEEPEGDRTVMRR